MENDENKINLEKEEDQRPSTPPVPPPAPSNDEEWAEKLGLDFDPEQAATPPPVPPVNPSERPEPSFTAPAPPAPANVSPISGDEVMPPTFMIWSVLALVFCCFPTAIVAIIFSAQVSSRFYARDYEGARRASRRAEMWIIASVVLGVISMALYLPLTLLTP